MKRALTLSILVALLLSNTAMGRSTAPGEVKIQRYVIGGGGGRSEAASYVMHGTAGQPTVATTSGGPYELCSGFWCGSGQYTIFVPLVLK
jgi:hypothetical protein